MAKTLQDVLALDMMGMHSMAIGIIQSTVKKAEEGFPLPLGKEETT